MMALVVVSTKSNLKIKQNRVCLFKHPFNLHNANTRRSQWPCGLSRGSAAARLLGLWVRIPPGESMFVSWVLTAGGLCVGLVTRLEEFYRVWCDLSVIVQPR
jgi:hypothetical protein